MCYLGELWHGAESGGGWSGLGLGRKAWLFMGLGGRGFLELVVTEGFQRVIFIGGRDIVRVLDIRLLAADSRRFTRITKK